VTVRVEVAVVVESETSGVIVTVGIEAVEQTADSVTVEAGSVMMEVSTGAEARVADSVMVEAVSVIVAVGQEAVSVMEETAGHDEADSVTVTGAKVDGVDGVVVFEAGPTSAASQVPASANA
jgi:hypothetical protein